MVTSGTWLPESLAWPQQKPASQSTQPGTEPASQSTQPGLKARLLVQSQSEAYEDKESGPTAQQRGKWILAGPSGGMCGRVISNWTVQVGARPSAECQSKHHTTCKGGLHLGGRRRSISPCSGKVANFQVLFLIYKMGLIKPGLFCSVPAAISTEGLAKGLCAGMVPIQTFLYTPCVAQQDLRHLLLVPFHVHRLWMRKNLGAFCTRRALP